VATIYSTQTWILTIKYENTQRIFEGKILRKIFGPLNIDKEWRIRNNMKIDNLIEGTDRYSEIHYGTKNQMAGAYPKNGPSKTN
jgi:hypothetical protein